MRFCYDFLLSQTIHSVQGDGSELIHFVTTYSQTQTPLVPHGNHHDRNFSKDLPCGKALHTSQKMQTHGENCHPAMLSQATGGYVSHFKYETGTLGE